MKRFICILSLFLGIIFISQSCDSVESVDAEISTLKAQRKALQESVVDYQKVANGLTDEINSKKAISEELSSKNRILVSGVRPKYVLTLHLRQISYSLSITKQIRDAANAVDFQIMVDEDYYNSVRVGEEVVDNFRVGSLFMRGSFGDWRITVANKEIQ